MRSEIFDKVTLIEEANTLCRFRRTDASGEQRLGPDQPDLRQITVHGQPGIGLKGAHKMKFAHANRACHLPHIQGLVIREESRQHYRDIIQRLIARGAQAIILGCTEIMLLVSQEDSAVPVFDTTEIHALAAVDRALEV